MPVTQNEVTPQWANYVDLQRDVLPWLQIPESSEASHNPKLGLLVDGACQWVQNYLGRPIAPTTFFRRFNGWSSLNGAYVTLPYYPVLKVEKVIEWWGVSGEHVLEEQTPAKQSSNEQYAVDWLKGQIIRVFQGLVMRPFFPGVKNIEITWVAGYDPIPADIKIATLEHIAVWYRNTQQASRARPANAEYDPLLARGIAGEIAERVEPYLQPYLQIGMG